MKYINTFKVYVSQTAILTTLWYNIGLPIVRLMVTDGTLLPSELLANNRKKYVVPLFNPLIVVFLMFSYAIAEGYSRVFSDHSVFVDLLSIWIICVRPISNPSFQNTTTEPWLVLSTAMSWGILGGPLINTITIKFITTMGLQRWIYIKGQHLFLS